MIPVPGNVVYLAREASPQFGDNEVTLRVTKAGERHSSVSGWMWITGYTLDSRGNALLKREVFVKISGVIGSRR